jgi:hypothetical protein
MIWFCSPMGVENNTRWRAKPIKNKTKVIILKEKY